MPALVLSARQVARRFGRRVVLEPLDLDLAEGEVVALGGPNGAGKSTLLAILAGALPRVVATSRSPSRPASAGCLGSLRSTAGSRRREPGALRTARRARGAGRCRGQGARSRRARGEERRAAELSVGNVQRVNLAIGLLGEPDILLLDEPTASLDVAQRQRLWRLVDGLRATGGAVLFATHSLDEARKAADRLIVLQDGRAVYAGPPGDYLEESA